MKSERNRWFFITVLGGSICFGNYLLGQFCNLQKLLEQREVGMRIQGIICLHCCFVSYNVSF